jgi:hypothetical protein
MHCGSARARLGPTRDASIEAFGASGEGTHLAAELAPERVLELDHDRPQARP